jgi:hypothetical protein
MRKASKSQRPEAKRPEMDLDRPNPDCHATPDLELRVKALKASEI